MPALRSLGFMAAKRTAHAARTDFGAAAIDDAAGPWQGRPACRRDRAAMAVGDRRNHAVTPTLGHSRPPVCGRRCASDQLEISMPCYDLRPFRRRPAMNAQDRSLMVQAQSESTIAIMAMEMMLAILCERGVIQEATNTIDAGAIGSALRPAAPGRARVDEEILHRSHELDGPARSADRRRAIHLGDYLTPGHSRPARHRRQRQISEPGAAAHDIDGRVVVAHGQKSPRRRRRAGDGGSASSSGLIVYS